MNANIHYVKKIKLGNIQKLVLDNGRIVFTRDILIESEDTKYTGHKEKLCIALHADKKEDLKIMRSKELLIG